MSLFFIHFPSVWGSAGAWGDLDGQQPVVAFAAQPQDREPG